jgi:hypothetical protein
MFARIEVKVCVAFAPTGETMPSALTTNSMFVVWQGSADG